MPSIEIPEHLKPADGRFGCGPSKIRTQQLTALTDNRAASSRTTREERSVPALTGRIREGLRELFALPAGHEVVLGAGGTSAFWQVAAYGLVRRRSQHLVFGLFSSMFADITGAAPWLRAPSVREAPPGTHACPAPEAGIDTYALTHCETSTGVAMPVERVGGGAEKALTVVDATSAAGALAVAPDAYDVYYFGPQKCFGAEGSTWVALLSPAALERMEEIAASDRYIPEFFSLLTAVESSRRDTFPEEPSTTGLFFFAEQLDWILRQGGLAWCTARTAESSRRLYEWAEKSSYATPFVREPAQRAPVAGTIDLDEAVEAPAVIRTLRANGIVDLEANRKWGPNQIRVGMYPAVEPDDVEALTHCIDHVVERLG
ncbi:phosphoserine transaminase [Streptomyces iconiensis]|uniref:phosphoserine transaminase n=1 Tax=Streptomyces iconiensis TaxID=1384038 RepID=A0ABT6ZYW9_9ACTN|nr:phosphoserine transaminase [Streptomyces iconiensis]MDJ1133618.1 phosphoserine transaminase [Streptomyces iconiensis]